MTVLITEVSHCCLCLAKCSNHVLLKRALQYMRTACHWHQAGFMPNRSTIDQISVLRQLIEKHREFWKDCHLYIALIDLKAAFDLFDWPSLLLILQSIGESHMIGDMLAKLCDGTGSCVRLNGQDSPLFPVTTGM